MRRIQEEPALVLGAIQALVAMAVGFGLDITAEQVGLIVAASAAVLSVVTRSQVTPSGNVWTAKNPKGD